MLTLGFLTTVSGRWPRELPQRRHLQYGQYIKNELPFAKMIAAEGIVDSPQKQRACVERFRKEGVDLVIMVYGAFTGDDVCTCLAEELRVPLVLWAPFEPPFDGGRLLANALVSVTMNSASMKRLGFPSHVIYGSLDDPRATSQLRQLVKAYSTVKTLKGTVLGLLGYRPTAFYNSAFDEGLIRRVFGVRMEETDLQVVFDIMRDIDGSAIKLDAASVSRRFETSMVPEEHLENHSRLYLALKRIMEMQRYDFAVLKCWPEMGALKATPCAVLGRLADENIHIGCEGDVDVTLTLVLQNLIAAKPCFITDMINIDEAENTLTFWHCGNPAPSLFDVARPIQMCDHPLAGQGTAFYGALKGGCVTVARLCNIGHEYKLFLLRGEAVETKPYTKGAMVNVRIKMPVRDFVYRIMEQLIPHHYSIVWGDIADDMIQAADLLGVKVLEF